MGSSEINAALEKLSQTFASRPEKALVKHAPVTATLESGLACRITGLAGEEIKTDMPGAMGGNASGPNPGSLFRASLASCLTTVIAMRAARLGIELSKLEVAVESDGNNQGIIGLDDRISAGMSGLRTTVQIAARNCTQAELDELVIWADKHSPVSCTLREAPSNALVIRAA
jgi:uncharacterized OsmC-like protein